MAVLTDAQIQNIILNNPNKALIHAARDYSAKLSLHILGRDMETALKRNDYFENEDVFASRNNQPTSNADLFARLLQREEMVFTAKGGASMYGGLDEGQAAILDSKLDRIRFNMSIRKWVKEFALQAYRTDPMGVLFVEADATANSYPTYKSTDCIYDYQTTGRKLEYIAFRLQPAEAKQFLSDAGLDTSDENLNIRAKYTTVYFRYVDDARDLIIKSQTATISILHEIPLPFDATPGLIVSDIIDFTNPVNFLSPVHKTVELADTYLTDRSIRDLSKKYSGFPKGYEPILSCTRCTGTGFVSGQACPECTPTGATKGLGIKLRTKVADIARFPLPAAGQPNNTPDPSKFFGYITPSIETWDKQDTSLNDIESAMNDTYWGTGSKQSTTGPTTTDKHAFKETATKTLADLQPIYNRLNITADWAQATENAIVNFIGKQLFANFKQSMRTYGRYYILETPDELIEEYLDQKTKGAPQSTLFDTLRKYYHSVFANDPMQLAIKLKLINVEPFVHLTIVQVQASNPSRIDFFCKMYYSEWLATKDDVYLAQTKTEALIADMIAYSTLKMVLPADLLVPPTVTIAETVKNTN